MSLGNRKPHTMARTWARTWPWPWPWTWTWPWHRRHQHSRRRRRRKPRRRGRERNHTWQSNFINNQRIISMIKLTKVTKNTKSSFCMNGKKKKVSCNLFRIQKTNTEQVPEKPTDMIYEGVFSKDSAYGPSWCYPVNHCTSLGKC